MSDHDNFKNYVMPNYGRFDFWPERGAGCGCGTRQARSISTSPAASPYVRWATAILKW